MGVAALGTAIKSRWRVARGLVLRSSSGSWAWPACGYLAGALDRSAFFRNSGSSPFRRRVAVRDALRGFPHLPARCRTESPHRAAVSGDFAGSVAGPASAGHGRSGVGTRKRSLRFSGAVPVHLADELSAALGQAARLHHEFTPEPFPSGPGRLLVEAPPRGRHVQVDCQ